MAAQRKTPSVCTSGVLGVESISLNKDGLSVTTLAIKIKPPSRFMPPEART